MKLVLKFECAHVCAPQVPNDMLIDSKLVNVSRGGAFKVRARAWADLTPACHGSHFSLTLITVFLTQDMLEVSVPLALPIASLQTIKVGGRWPGRL